MLWRTLILSLALLIGAHAQVSTAGAEQLLQQADAAFQRGDYAAAAQGYQQFLNDYGGSEEAKARLETLIALMATAQIQAGDWAGALPSIERYLTTYPKGQAVEDLSFWKGVCQSQAKDYDSAAKSLRAFIETFTKSERLPDARRMLGITQLAQEQFKESAATFGALAAESKGAMQGQARVLQLFSLMRGEEYDAALEIVKGMDPRMEEFDLVASFHLLTLRLGSTLLERDRPRDALFAFQKVWPRERIVARQTSRLAVLEKEERRLGKLFSARLLQVREVLGQVRRELETLQKMPDYDTALRLRTAQCFYRLKRFREAALVLADAMKRMPPSALLENAQMQLMACYAEMQRWEELIASAGAFQKKFPQSKFLPQLLYMTGEAHQRRNDFANAIAAYQEVLAKHPAFPANDRVTFLIGYNQLMLDQNEEAIKQLRRVPQEFPQSPMVESSYYWVGMAYSFNKQHAECREAMGDYLKRYPEGRFKAEATFRRAQTLYAQLKFAEAVPELRDFLKRFEGHPLTDETLLLLGDSHFAIAEIDAGIAAFERVSKTTPRFFEQAFFQIGKAYKLTEQPEKELAHYQRFVRENGSSNRVGEALVNIARIYRAQGKEEEARTLYWESIYKLGNDPENAGVDDLFLGVAKLYKGDEPRAQFLAKLRDMIDEATAKKQNTLAARALWTQAQITRRADPASASRALLAAAPLVVKPEEITARILADIADALREAGKAQQAQEAYEGLLMWHPRSMQRDRAYAGMGLLAAAAGKEKAALDYFDDFERETISSPLRPTVLQTKADLLIKRGQWAKAIVELEKILQIPAAKGKPWVEALAKIGDAHMALNKPDKAVPYYQRIYVMYGRYTDKVARAYWQSGQAFEKLNKKEEAINTYKEFTSREELAEMPEFEQARKRLSEIGGAA